MLLRVFHRTLYRYPAPSFDSHNEVRLMPLTDTNQTCLRFQLTTRPAARVAAYEEPGGTVHHFHVRDQHRELEITAEALVDTYLHDPFRGVDLAEGDWSSYRSPEVARRFAEFLGPSPYVPPLPQVREIAEHVREGSDGTLVGFLLDLNRALHQRLDYDPDVTHVHTKLDEVVELHAGVCQDFAHLMLGCCRAQGIPARYVSGYLDVAGSRGESATHAWVEAWLPNDHWLALDPTNNLLANDRYVRVHVGRDYADVTPTRGVYTGAPAEELTVEVSVQEAEPTSLSRAG